MALLNVVLDSTKKCELKPDSTPSLLVYLYQATVLPCGDPGSWASFDGLCYYRTITTPAIPPSTTIHTITPTTYSYYSDLGTIFYNPGFAIDGTGSNTLITTNDVWKNSTTTNGPMNRSDIWTNIDSISGQDQPLDKWVGVVSCLTGITTAKTYYIGIAADNEYKLVIDGSTIIDSFYYGGALDSTHHRYWHVYPISILAGQHQIHLFGMNRSDIAAFGCEIYDNTYSELTGATLLSQLNIIFSSRSQSDVKLIQLSNGTYTNEGYTCTTGSYLACNNSCVDIEICCSSGITTTTTTTLLPTTTTTSSTTTTTTTLLTADITVNNGGSYTGDTITSVLVNGVNISNMSFPITYGNYIPNGKTNQLGTYDVEVGYTAQYSGGSIEIWNPSLVTPRYTSCQDISTVGIATFNFEIISGDTINILLYNTPCSLSGSTTTTTTIAPTTTTTTTAAFGTVDWSLTTDSGIGGMTITKNGVIIVSGNTTASGSFAVNDGDGLECIVGAILTGHTSTIHVGAGSSDIYDNSSPVTNVGYSVGWSPIYGAYNLTFVGVISLTPITTTTTSTTLAPTTTTTTTLAPTTTTTTTITGSTATIEITNNGLSGDSIVGVSLNSVYVTGITFPVLYGGNYFGTTNQLAGYSIVVDFDTIGVRTLKFYLNGSGTPFDCVPGVYGTGTVGSSPITLSAGDTVQVLLSSDAC